MLRYHDIRASSSCILPKSFCNSTYVIDIQNDDNYCFLWSILAQKYTADSYRDRVSFFKKHFHEPNQGYIQFPMKMKNIPTFERLNNLTINVFELSANDKTLTQIC